MVARVRSWWGRHPIWAGAAVSTVAVALLVGTFLMSAGAATTNLHPDAELGSSRFLLGGGAADSVSAVAASGSGGDIYHSNRNQPGWISYSIENPSLSGTISSVDLVVVANSNSSRSMQVDALVSGTSTGDQTTFSNLGTSFTSYTISGVSAPGGSWDWTEISNLQARIDVTASGTNGNDVRIDEIYFVVNYAAAPTLDVTAGTNGPSAKFYSAQGDTYAVDDYDVTANDGDVTITQFVVRGLDTVGVLLTDVTGVEIYEDDGDNVWDAGDTQIGTTQTFSGNASGSSATFGSLSYTVTQSTTEKIWVVYDIGSSAVDGHIVGSELQDGDITVSGGQSVNTFSTITSANSGQTIDIDATGPTVSISDPGTSDVLTGSAKTISGTASDAELGVNSVDVRIQRSDSNYWNGSAWVGGETWNAATGTTNWTYSWSLDAGQQSGDYTYTITARADDNGSNVGTSPSVTGVTVDNVAPQMSSAVAIDATHVDVVWDEDVDAATIAASDFTIAGLTVSAATLDADGVTVHLTTSSQTAGNSYTVQSAAGNVADLAGNTNAAESAGFTGFTPTPELTVSQGSDAGRPTAKIYRTQSDEVAVDEINLAAANGDITVASIQVRGLDTIAGLTTDVTAVRLFEDDGDGTWDAGDTQIGTTRTFPADASGSLTSFGALAYTITQGTSENIWVVYTIGASATDGHIVGSELQDGDVTVTGGHTVTFAATPITSANSGQTIEVDAVAPTVSISDPSSDTTLTGSSKAISGTASDARSGLNIVEVRIQRSDGQYWNGTGWTGTATWNTATGTSNWTYSWDLDAGQQAGDYTYTITARADDNVGLTGTSLSVTNVTVDNTAPTLVSAVAVDATHVDVVWSEDVDGATLAADGSDFTITGGAGLAVTAATLDADGVTVHLTTASQVSAQSYTVNCAAGNIADLASNTNPATNANFTGFTVAGGNLTVTQGSDAGRPTALVYRARNSVLAVDEMTLSAASGAVSLGQISVRGLDTVDALTTDVTAVRLFEDDGDGVFTEGGDTQIGTTQTFGADASGTAVTFSSLSYTIPDAQSRSVWIVYTIGASATDGHIVGSRVNNGDLVASSGTVLGFTDIVSANSGQTVHIDAAAPTADTSDPVNDVVLTGSAKTVSGTASDGTGSGLSAVTLRILRSDGRYWDAGSWSVVEAWNPVTGTTNWTYGWSLDAGQDRDYTYTLTARATDNVALTGSDASPVTNVSVDNVGPSLQSAVALNENTVDVTFTEPLDASTVAGDGSDFTIPGLTISAAAVQSGNQVVRLTTDSQTPAQAYAVQVAAGVVDDPYGNAGTADSAGFLGFGGGSDTEPPTVPGSVTATAGAAPPAIATITWTASTDNVGVVGYRIWRSMTATSTPVKIGTTTGLTFDDESGIPGQTYYYAVSAYDAAGNESAMSALDGPVVSLWTRAPHATYTAADKYCAMCHDPHLATNDVLMRPTGGAPGELSVCYACHDGQGANANILSGPTNSFALASGHSMEESATGADLTNTCSSCHAPHVEWTSNTKLPRSEVNSAAVTGADNSWCFACHNDANDWYGAGYPGPTTPSRDTSGYPVSGPYTGETTYKSESANAHASIPASATTGREAGDCLYCHDSHRGPNEYDMLSLTFRPTSPSTIATDQASGVYAESCFYCHGGVLPSELATAPTDIKQFVTAGATRSGHRIKTAGGTLPVGAPLPCYDCHNPHGSKRGNAKLISDELGQSLDTSSAAGVRAMCFTCHASSDGQVWDSAGSTYAAVGTDEVEGLRRDGSDGSVLTIPTVNGHDSSDTQSCYQCHGDSYASGGTNVHNPSGGVSAGGEECYSCHSAYQTYMEDSLGSKTGSSQTTVYHHVMGSASNDGDIAPNTGSYPTSNQDVYCVSCHVDHNYFNDEPGANLRADITNSSATTATSDFDTSSPYGICISCHDTPRTKDTTDQKDDGTSVTQPLDGAVYDASAHQYAVASEFGAGNTFNADCSKCHNDEQTKDFQSSTNKFGTHWSDERRLLSAFGVTLSDPLEENHCYGCHSAVGAYVGAKTVAGRDWYGADGAVMSSANEEVYEPFEDLGGSSHPVKATASGSVECENCHNPHRVNGTSTVSDPDNTLTLAPYSSVAEQAAFCMTCHDGTAPAYESNATTYVPHPVTLADPSDDKTTYEARGHWSASGSIGVGDVVPCADCHDNHGSSAPKLLGEYDATTGNNFIGATQIDANDNDVCSACHTSSSTSFPALEAQREASTGYLMDGTWPGMVTYNTAYVPSTHTGNGHTTATAVWPGKSYTGGDCKNCHDVHGTDNTYDELRTENAAGTHGTYGFAADDFSMCFNCHDSDGPAATDIKQYYPVASGGTSTGDRAGHQIVTSVVGANLGVGDALPCYDCHNPHGSASAYGLQVRGIGDSAGEINVSTDDGVRKFCFTCHTTSDTTQGWNGAAYAAVGVTEVEGFRRDGSDGSVLELPSVSGHASTDTQSCYACHGNDANNNPHNPTGGISIGGQDCYGCHSAYRQYMEDGTGTETGANRTDNYHHVMGSATNEGDEAFASGSYPNSATDVYCLSCHVDHDMFNDAKSGNLRTDLAATPTSTTSDYLTTGSNGICVQCHTSSLTKDTTNQADDGSTATPKIVAGTGSGGFGNSAHLYPVTTSYSDASDFEARCSKCHNDEQTKDFQTSTYKVGVHWSASRRILSALGTTQSDPLQEEHCYRCHSETGDSIGGTVKSTANRDWYDETAMTTASERVYQQFQKTSMHPVVAAGGDSVECESCHNAHVATAANPTTDPDNTYDLHAYGTVTEQTSYCLTCHDAGLPSYTVNGTTYIPYSVTQADTAVNDKTTYAARSHWTAYGSIGSGEVQACADCHDNHGSDYPKLLGAYDTGTDSNRINATAISGNNNTVCAACHTSASTGFPAASRDANGYPDDGTWPGTAVYDTAYNSTAHTGSFHLSANGGGNSTLPNISNGDCKVCHDVHGTVNLKDELNGVSAAASFNSDNFALCFDCHDTDGPGDTNVKTYYPGAVGGSGGGTGHEILTSGGTLSVGDALPCYNCHNPHGTSDSSYGLMIVTMTDSSTTITLGDAAGEISMSPAQQATASNVRNFCFTCHTTSDTTKGWNGSALAVVGAGATVEGLDRTTGTKLKLPSVTGHNEADAQSCYQCHGNDYSGVSTNNVHNPSGGVSEGGQDCYGCHTIYESYMEYDGSNRTTVYHHVVGDATDSGDTAFTYGSYPAAGTDVYCLSCHMDHDQFNSGQASNLRDDMASSPTSVATDYLTTGAYGVCIDCHDASLTKDTTNQKDDGSTATPVITGGTGAGGFGNSAHEYTTTSSYGDATTFSANCSKCHNDENSPTYKDFQTSTDRFGTHWSATRRLLSALGGAVADPLGESHCYRCHSQTSDGLAGTKKSTANRDWYDATAMTDAAERVYTQFQLSSSHPVVAAGGDSVECESCHNAHVVTSSAIVTDPDNTYNAHSYTTVADQASYCLTCHDAGLPSYTVNGTTYIPYSVTQADTAANNKSTYSARAHWTANGSIGSGEVQACADCHDNHGSSYPVLLGAYDVATSSNRINGTAITGNDNSVCYACHTSASTGYPTYSRDANGYPDDGTWPGSTIYTSGNGIHRGASVIWPGSSYTGGDCNNCHDVHGTANTKDELRGTFSDSNFGNCFECHDGAPASRNIKQYYPTDNGGDKTQAADTNYGHKIQTSGGTLTVGEGLPCYDCHNPHGSAIADGLQVVTMTNSSTTISIGDTAGEFDLSDDSGVREFCFACHTTSNNTNGWNGSSYAAVSAGAEVEGIDRTTSTVLKLPAVSGHASTDTQSCYSCHGEDYSSGTSNNVHNPGPGGSNGGIECLNCHGSSAAMRLDKMVNDTTTYHHVMDAANPDSAPNTGTYPTSQTSLECVSCHTDHNYFNSSKGSNLRTSITNSSGASNTNSDFISGGSPSYGICISCHSTSKTKNSTGQKTTNGSSGTPALSGSAYDASKHDYNYAAAYGSDTFNANCSKCHDDEQDSLQTYQTSTYKIGTHYSADTRVARALGAAIAGGESTEENLCLACHDGVGAGNDGYGTQAMSASARGIQTQMDKIDANPLANMGSGHDVTGYSGVHVADEYDNAPSTVTPSTTDGWWGSGNADLHVECEDCHDPHEAQAASFEFPTESSGSGSRPVNTAVAVSGANKGVWGVTITGSSSGKWSGSGSSGSPTQPTYTKVADVTYEWQLCLKCHSSYAWGQNTPPNVPSGEGKSATTGGSTRNSASMTDVGLDFNPMHYAYHPLFETGRNQPPTNANSTWVASGIARQNPTTIGLANTMTDGWFTTSLVSCSDCHGNSSWGTTDAHGVHGSDQPWILRGVNTGVKVTLHSGSTTYPNASPPTGSGNVCINCHRADVYGYGDGNAPSTNDDQLSRNGHLGSNQVAKCGDGVDLPWAPAESGCYLCHGGRGDDNTEAVGVAHGSSMDQGDGASSAADGNDAQDGTLSGDEMGKRFMNGAGWDHHTLGDTSGNIGCSPVNSSNQYSSCTNHSGIDGKSGAPEYYYTWN